MRTEQTAGGKVILLAAEDILKYFLSTDEQVDTLIKCKTVERIVTTDQNLYQALGSLRDSDGFKMPSLVKFFESVEINPSRKYILTHERVEELRKMALQGGK